MKRVYVNEQWCLGCHLCEYYCAFANSGKSDMVKALKGVVTIDESKCVGCYTCVASCPYGAVLPGAHGAVQKCELCTQSGGVPACVEHCPNKAIVFEERGAGA